MRLPAPSTLVFLGLALTLVGAVLFFKHYDGDFPLRSQAQVFTWPVVGGIIVFALCGLLCSRAAKLPEPFSDLARERRAWIVAALTGALYGLMTVNSDLQAETQRVHMALPWSLVFYPPGAIFIEFMLRLGALCVVFWFLHVVIFRRRFRLPLFWLVAAVVALYEVSLPMTEEFSSGRWGRGMMLLAGPLYLSNVFEGWLLLRYGWFSPIVFRLSFYLFWHILYGGLAHP